MDVLDKQHIRNQPQEDKEMDYLFDPSTQVGNPILLFIERLFYGGLAIFLFGALSTAIKKGLTSSNKDNKD